MAGPPPLEPLPDVEMKSPVVLPSGNCQDLEQGVAEGDRGPETRSMRLCVSTMSIHRTEDNKVRGLASWLKSIVLTSSTCEMYANS